MKYGMSAATLVLVLLYSAAPAAGQTGPPPVRGMVVDGGEWRNPTVEEALHALTLEGRGEWRPLRSHSVHSPMTAILRQALGQDPAIDLDGLADALADMILADRSPEGRVRRNAAAALRWASSTTTTDYGGTPHAKSLDALVRVYETRVAQVLATSGGEDPFLEAQGSQRELLRTSLFDIFWADREGRGRDYVLGIQQRSNPPPEYCGEDGRSRLPQERLAMCRGDSTWCVAGRTVYARIVRDARTEDARRRGFSGVWIVNDGEVPPLPPGLDEAAARWFRLCY